MTRKNDLKPLRSVVTLRDVAAAAGVSIGTVSHALSGSGSVAQATRERVRSCADELGYVRDVMQAHRPRSGRVHAIPIAVLGTDKDWRPYHNEKLDQIANSLGYQLHREDPEQESDPKILLQRMLERGCQGLVIHHRANRLFPQLAQADWSPLAVVIRGPMEQGSPYCHIYNSIFEHWFLAWQIMIQHGHQHIGAIIFNHDPAISDDRLREAACLAGQDLLPASAQRIPPCCCHFEDRDALKQWVERYQPAAIIGFNDHPLNLLGDELKGRPYLAAWLSSANEQTEHPLARVSYDFVVNNTETIMQLDRLLRLRMRGPLEHPFSISAQPQFIPGPSLAALNT